MSDPFVDTDVLIRLLTGDDPVKQAAATALFERVEAGELTLLAPDTVIADAVFVLSSRRLYNLPRQEVQQLLTTLLRLPRFRVRNRRALLRALEIYGGSNLDFGDALIVAAMHEAGSEAVFSFDRDFDRLPGISRIEP